MNVGESIYSGTPDAPQRLSQVLSKWTARLSAWQKALAYRHKQSEILLYLMFVSGLMLWPMLGVEWALTRWALFVHMLLGVTAFPVIVGSFWWSHRRLLLRSRKAFLRTTGRCIEWLLLMCTFSGAYLWYFGVTGDSLSLLIQDIHFYSSCLLGPLVLRHAFRWSVLNVFKK